MAVDTIVGLKAKMPANTPGGTTIADIHDLIDTLEEFTTQRVSAKTASYTATNADNRTFFTMNVASANTFTVPSAAPVGWECAVLQIGTGQTTIAVLGTGQLLAHPDSHTKISKRYGMVYLKVYANSGTAPQVAFTGDTAA
jgi:hypothetical protein